MMIKHRGPNRRKTARKMALASGKKIYCGKVCPKHMSGIRYVATKRCVECTLAHGRRMRENGYKSTPYSKKWRENNRERARELGRNWVARNRQKHNAASLAYHKAHPEKGRLNQRNRRARLLAASGSHTQHDITTILAAQKNRCAYCQISLRKNYDVDHIIALSRGGSNDRTNLQILCISCNRSKNSRDSISFARERGMLL